MQDRLFFITLVILILGWTLIVFLGPASETPYEAYARECRSKGGIPAYSGWVPFRCDFPPTN